MFSPDGKTLLINMQHDKAHLLDVDTSTYKANIKGKSGSFSTRNDREFHRLPVGC